MELNEVVADLYGTDPAGFLERRKEWVARARAAKDRDGVRTIAALRRPAVAAWSVNLLQRDAGGAGLADLAALGVALRDAQFGLQADLLRELGRERRTRVADLVSRAVDLAEAAGHTVSPAVEREIDETLVAAVADQAAAEAVLSGSLTRPLSYSGFGEVDLDLAVAMLPAAPRPAAPLPTGPGRAHHTVEPRPAPVDLGPSAAELRLDAEREARGRELHAALVVAESTRAAAVDDASRAAGRLADARTATTAAALAVADVERALTATRDRAAEADAEQQAAEAAALDSRRAEQAATDEVQRLHRACKDHG